MTSKPRPLVRIEWIDACQHQDGSADDPLEYCVSAGFAYRKGDGICLSWHLEESAWPENSTPLVAIPVRCIKSMCALKNGKAITLRSIPKEAAKEEQ